MDTAWCNHNPKDGNVGMETLARLGKIVEAMRVAVDGVLQVSGRVLEVKHGAVCPESTPSFPDEPLKSQQQQERISRNAGSIAATMVEVAEAAGAIGADDDGVDIVADETRGEAAMITKKVEVDIIGDQPAELRDVNTSIWTPIGKTGQCTLT